MNYKVCPVCGRLHTRRNSKGLCRKHEHQLLKYGKYLDNNPRTKFDRNEFRIKGIITEVDVYNLKGEVINTYTFDTEDYPLVSKYKWNMTKLGYCSTGYLKGRMFLHRMILGVPEGSQVDHINGDITDNRKVNLRICQNGLNMTNRRPYNKWNIKGIEQHRSGKWSAYIRKDNKQYHSPTFNTKEEAVFARFILEQVIYPHDVLTSYTPITIQEELKANVIQRTLAKINKL